MSSESDPNNKAAENALNDSDDEFDDAEQMSFQDMVLIVLSFLKDYADKGVLNEGVGSNNIEDAIKKVNETYGFIDSYPPLSEKLSIIDKDREGYRLLLSGYNPFEIEKEKFDALVNGSYSDRLMSDKYASIYYAYHDGFKVFERDMAAADVIWTIS